MHGQRKRPFDLETLVVSPAALSDLKEKILSCEICFNPYDAARRRPHVLPCHHSFCSRCLHVMARGKVFQCPYCRNPIHLNRKLSALQQLPLDRTLMNLLEWCKSALNGQRSLPDDHCRPGLKVSLSKLQQSRDLTTCQENEDNELSTFFFDKALVTLCTAILAILLLGLIWEIAQVVQQYSKGTESSPFPDIYGILPLSLP